MPSNEGNPAERPSKHQRSSSSASVPESPLQQVNVVNPQQPLPKPKLKVVALYETLFTQNEPHPPGYWIEFFLLPVNSEELSRVLSEAQPLTDHVGTVQTLVRGAVANLGQGKAHELPVDLTRNALIVLECVFKAVLKPSTTTKASANSKTSSQSAVQTLVGLERASYVLDELTSGVLAMLKPDSSFELVQAATRFVLHTSQQLQGTQLNGLFATKNFFAALLNVVDKYTDNNIATDAMAAVGVLTALNVYDDDGVPVYQQRISDYVDEVVMAKMIALVQRSFQVERKADSPGWLSWLRPTATAQGANGKAPSSTSIAANGKSNAKSQQNIFLPLFFFVLHNPIFCSGFTASPALISVLEYFGPHFSQLGKSESQHLNAWLGVIILRQIVDTEFPKLVDPVHEASIKIDAPKLDLDTSRRLPLAGIIDLAQVGLRAGVTVKKQQSYPDWELVDQFAGLLYQSCAQLVSHKTMWHNYNWTGMVKFVMGLIKHISTLGGGSNVVPILAKLLGVVVGMSLQRELLDEEDWTYILFNVVKMPTVFTEAAKISPIDQLPAIAVAQAMTAQYDLNKEKPDLPTVIKHGSLAAGRSLLEPLRPLSMHHPMLKRTVFAQINHTN